MAYFRATTSSSNSRNGCHFPRILARAVPSVRAPQAKVRRVLSCYRYNMYIRGRSNTESIPARQTHKERTNDECLKCMRILYPLHEARHLFPTRRPSTAHTRTHLVKGKQFPRERRAPKLRCQSQLHRWGQAQVVHHNVDLSAAQRRQGRALGHSSMGGLESGDHHHSVGASAESDWRVDVGVEVIRDCRERRRLAMIRGSQEELPKVIVALLFSSMRPNFQ